jgi:hypothetical protein
VACSWLNAEADKTIQRRFGQNRPAKSCIGKQRYDLNSYGWCQWCDVMKQIVANFTLQRKERLQATREEMNM